MNFSEAETQVLASLSKSETGSLPCDRESLEEIGTCYSSFKENWDSAFGSLIARGLIRGNDQAYYLTESGRPSGQFCLSERPDMYWYHYQKFYPAAHASATHSRLCEIVFGQDLCQEGQTDMSALEHLLELLDLQQGETALDLGCGAGVIAEYISDTTGASVTGIDYAAPAIAEALRRTSAKRSRLNYLQGDFNNLVLEPASYDVVYSIDTLYQDEGLEEIIAMVSGALKPGGRMGIFLNHHIAKGDAAELLESRHSILSRILTQLDLPFESYDYNDELVTFWNRLRQASIDLRDDFENEGNGFIAENYLREAEDDHLLEIEAGTIARALYVVRP